MSKISAWYKGKKAGLEAGIKSQDFHVGDWGSLLKMCRKIFSGLSVFSHPRPLELGAPASSAWSLKIRDASYYSTNLCIFANVDQRKPTQRLSL